MRSRSLINEPKLWVRTLSLRPIGVVAFVIGWQLLTILLPRGWMAGPIETVQTLIGIAVKGQLIPNLLDTLRRAIQGCLIGLVLAIAFGIGMGLKKYFDYVFEYTVFVIMCIPSLAWAILGLLWIGLNEMAAIAVVSVICFPSAVLTLREGVRAIDAQLIALAKSYRISRWKIVWEVVMPSLYPYLFASARNGLGLAWQLTVIVEMISQPSGVGRMLRLAYTNLYVDEILAWALAFAISVLLIDNVFLKVVERRVFRWRKQL